MTALKILLDEHISPAVAEGFRKRNKTVPIVALAEFENGRLIGLPDQDLLAEAARLGLTLATYDLRTIPPLLKSWAEQNRAHSGVIFIDEKTIPPSSDFGAISRALQKIAAAYTRDAWLNRVVFLSR